MRRPTAASSSPRARNLGALLLGCGLMLATPDVSHSETGAQQGRRADAARCRQDGDCSGTQLCIEGRCGQPRCRRDDDCAAGRMCRRGVCRIRECDSDMDCQISRRCDQGICALPDPNAPRVRASTAAMPDFDGGISVGPAFPGGLLAELEVDVGSGRSLFAGMGTTTDAAGLCWRAGMRVLRGALGSWQRDVWLAVQGLSGAAGKTGSWTGAALGSPRKLFEQGPAVDAMWWAVGAGLSLPHGADGMRILRLELGAAMLLDGRYRTATDVAILPSFGLRYGLRF